MNNIWPVQVKTTSQERFLKPHDCGSGCGPQLIVGLEGRTHFTLALKKGSTSIHLDPGEALYLSASCSVTPLPKGDFRSLSICAQPNKLQVQTDSGKMGEAPEKTHTVLIEEYWEPLHRLSQYLEDIQQAHWGIKTRRVSVLLARLVVETTHGILTHAGWNKKMLEQSHSRQTFEDTCAFLKENGRRAMTCKEIADAVGVDSVYMARALKKYSGVSVKFLHTFYRMEFARHLLLDEELSLETIAKQCAYKSKVYFIEAFREFHGLPPLQFRKLFEKNKKSRAEWLKLSRIKGFEILEPLPVDAIKLHSRPPSKTNRYHSAIMCNAGTRTIQLQKLDEEGRPHRYGLMDPATRELIITPNNGQWLFTDLKGNPLSLFRARENNCIGVYTD